jgi:hypothetical protein
MEPYRGDGLEHAGAADAGADGKGNRLASAMPGTGAWDVGESGGWLHARAPLGW